MKKEIYNNYPHSGGFYGSININKRLVEIITQIISKEKINEIKKIIIY